MTLVGNRWLNPDLNAPLGARAASGSGHGKLNIVRMDSVPEQPWANGGGISRELLTWPSAEHWRLRVSVADIDSDGPFSAYPGVDRWFAVLLGAGVVLSLPQGDQRVVLGDDALRFHGADAPHCRLIDDPTRDLNLMLRGAYGHLQRVGAGVTVVSDAPLRGVFVAHTTVLRTGGGYPISLDPMSLAWQYGAPVFAGWTCDQEVWHFECSLE